MNEHYIVTLDPGHLRIYSDSHFPDEGPSAPALVESMDLPEEVPDGSPAHPRQPVEFGNFGGRKEDRETSDEEEQRRRLGSLATEINAFLRSRPTATWDFAAPPELHFRILEQLSPRTRLRLRRSLSKDLTHENPGDVQAEFSAA